MSNWAPWSLDGEPLALRRYVLRGAVARHVRLPGPSAEDPLARLEAVYAALAGLKIGYAHEAPTDEAGRQVIRPPDQVLWAPRHATCLDLALVLAGGCLSAGLHPAVVILAQPDRPGSLHALLLVRLDHDLRRAPTTGREVWLTPPVGWLNDVHGTARDVIAVDPVGVAVSLGFTRTVGLDAGFDDAVTSGTRYLTGADGVSAWDWKVGVDIGAAWREEDAMHLDAHPASEPLRPRIGPRTLRSRRCGCCAPSTSWWGSRTATN